MLDVAKMDVTLPPPPETEDIQIGILLAACDAQPTTPLVFTTAAVDESAPATETTHAPAAALPGRDPASV